MMYIRMFVAVVITGLFSAIAIVLLPIDRKHRVFHWIARNWAKIILWLFGVKATVRGSEHVKSDRNYVFVSNHASMFDIPAVLGNIPDRVSIVLKKELTRVPIWGWALQLGPYIVLDRFHAREAARNLDEAAQKIRNGKSVLLFAEGTRTPDGKLQAFKRGAFSIAVKSGIPVIPVTINNTYRIMQKGSFRINPMDIELVLGEPIDTAQYTGREGEVQLMQRVHQAIKEQYIEQEK